MKKSALLFFILFSTWHAAAQYGYGDSNRIGINAGINMFALQTNNFDMKPETGWNIGLSMRGNYYNNFDMVFGLQFSENRYSVETYNLLGAKEDVKYKIDSAQLSLLLSYKVVPDHLSFEIGPMFQLNGKAVVDNEQEEDNIVAGQLYTAKDITDINNFSFYPTIGVTAGVKRLRASVVYQYGVSNVLNKLNDGDFGGGFKGHASIVSGNVFFYF